MITFPVSTHVGKKVHEITVFSSFVRQIAGGLLDADTKDLHTAEGEARLIRNLE